MSQLLRWTCYFNHFFIPYLTIAFLILVSVFNVSQIFIDIFVKKVILIIALKTLVKETKINIFVLDSTTL